MYDNQQIDSVSQRYDGPAAFRGDVYVGVQQARRAFSFLDGGAANGPRQIGFFANGSGCTTCNPEPQPDPKKDDPPHCA